VKLSERLFLMSSIAFQKRLQRLEPWNEILTSAAKGAAQELCGREPTAAELEAVTEAIGRHVTELALGQEQMPTTAELYAVGALSVREVLNGP
jgi:hypothetical protein